MLQFILGRASSGKTYTVTQKIAKCLSQGESPVLLVPEQFSFESEKNILDVVGDIAAQRVPVISFTRLCDEIEREAGGICGESITDADRIILMNRAIKLCKDDLVRFKKYASSTSFARLIIDSIGEFKTNFISCEDLRIAADSTDDEQLRLKLLDTALIYENYDALISEKFIDNTDRLTKLYYALEGYKYFENKTVFIDSFKGFSGQQYKILERIISQAKNVTITLVDNPQDIREFGIFSNIKKVKNRITAIARKFAVQIEDDMVLKASNYGCAELTALEEFMATGSAKFEGECKNITVCRADSIYNEADFVARNIRRIVRETGARYNDFVIIARDTAPYENALEVACKKNDISCFIDKRIPLSSMPTAVALMSAASAARNFSTENILRFHKSGVGILDFEQIATLENYAYLWSIEGEDWLKEWTMDPDGFIANGSLNEDAINTLSNINTLRRKAIEPLYNLKSNFKGNAQDMARALVNLFDECDLAQRFKNLSKRESFDTTYTDAIRQSWASIMKILNSLSVCFGYGDISKKVFCDALSTALSLETVGLIPQMIDEAIFGEADRIRPSRPKYAFVMGANQGVFPRLQENSGLFVSSEREKLISLGLDIPNKVFSLAVDEECLLYSNLCCASEGVFISYSNNIDGIAAEPSVFVTDIIKCFKCAVFDEPSALNEKHLPETLEDAFSQLCVGLSNNGGDTLTLTESLRDTNMFDRVNNVLSCRENGNYFISGDTAKQLFGNKIVMSPSKFDTFNRCRFMYFCRYGLRVERLQPAEFNAMQRGTIVHYVLQRAVEDYGKGLGNLTVEQINALVEKYTNEYLNMIAGYGDIETPYLKFLVSTIKRSLKFVVARLALEFAQSDFNPVKCELKIGYSGDMPEIKIPIENCGTLELIGVVDRLDEWNGYIRIVDYKTGHRDFRLPDILFGQNMQMLIYLYAVSKNKKFGGKAAGIFYMPASRDKSNSKSARRMNGLITADEALVYAMDKENKGEFIPKYSEKSPSDSYISAESFDQIFEFIESKLKRTGRAIYSGDIAADPIDGLDSGACKYCEYQSICRKDGKRNKSVPRLTNQEVFEEMKRQVSKDGV